MESCTFLGVTFQNHHWPLVSKIWKPSKNHWKQWFGGWKSLVGDALLTPKPLKNHWVQWSVSKKVVNGDGQRVAKSSKIHWCQWFSRKKNIPSHRSQKMTIAHLYLKHFLRPKVFKAAFYEKLRVQVFSLEKITFDVISLPLVNIYANIR